MSKPSKRELILESQIQDLDDDGLKEFTLYAHEAVKNLTETKKADPEIIRMKEELARYVLETYTKDIKLFTVKLRAARSQLRLRNIIFQVKEELK
jgi:hypothetical protein